MLYVLWQTKHNLVAKSGIAKQKMTKRAVMRYVWPKFMYCQYTPNKSIQNCDTKQKTKD